MSGVRISDGSPEKTVDFDRKSTVFSTKYAFRRVKYCYAMWNTLRAWNICFANVKGVFHFTESDSFLFHNLQGKLFHINVVYISLKTYCIYYVAESQNPRQLMHKWCCYRQLCCGAFEFSARVNMQYELASVLRSIAVFSLS